MVVELSERLVIERWAGPIPPDQLEATEDLIGFYGSSYGAALHVLSARLGAMRVEAASSSAGDDRSDHTANLKALAAAVADLAAFMVSSPNVTLSEVERDLVAQVTGAGGATMFVPLVASWPRRG